MTGSVREGIEQRCLNVGMDAYLAKPYRKEQLHRILCRLLPGTEAESP
jgi:CheY-like chemotaxis protein